MSSAAGLTAVLAGCTDDGGSGADDEVTVGPGGEPAFEPESITVAVGETVAWVWDSQAHNVRPTSVPEDAEWEGHPDIVDDPNTYEHAFDAPGTYEYQCDTHFADGMVGEVVVEEE